MNSSPSDPENHEPNHHGFSWNKSLGERSTNIPLGRISQSEFDALGATPPDWGDFQKHLPERYIILNEIGRGGMGQVLKAIDRGPKLNQSKIVAIKRILGPHLNERDSVNLFLDEVSKAREFRHPNVIQMYHSDMTPLGPYIVMEFIEGQNLAEYLRLHGPIPESLAVEWFRKLAAALGCGHDKGLIHRDLKPQNILISTQQEPFLADFGIARKMTALDHTIPGFGPGTLPYMSPEQLENRTPQISQDVYSFGATLFHAVEGKPPFSGRTIPELIRAVMEGPAPKTTRVSDELADQIASCLDKDPQNRPARCISAVITPPNPLSSNAKSPPPSRKHPTSLVWILFATSVIGLAAGISTLIHLAFPRNEKIENSLAIAKAESKLQENAPLPSSESPTPESLSSPGPLPSLLNDDTSEKKIQSDTDQTETTSPPPDKPKLVPADTPIPPNPIKTPESKSSPAPIKIDPRPNDTPNPPPAPTVQEIPKILAVRSTHRIGSNIGDSSVYQNRTTLDSVEHRKGIQLGTVVTVLEHDLNAKRVYVEWRDSKGTPRLGWIDDSFFKNN
jgi:serine/threonine protein kinase